MKEGRQRPVDGLAAAGSHQHPSTRRGGPTRAFRGLLGAVLLAAGCATEEKSPKPAPEPLRTEDVVVSNPPPLPDEWIHPVAGYETNGIRLRPQTDWWNDWSDWP